MNTKEILQKLHDVFTPKSETELSEEIKETEVVQEEVELADEPKEEKDAPVEEAKVEYVTKLEFQEFAKTFMQLLEDMQKPKEDKKDVPQDLSATPKEAVELAEEVVEELTPSPEDEVSKKFDLYTPKSNKNESIQSRVYSRLFS